MTAATWITNITHFMPEDPAAALTPEARRLRDYFGLIISAATASLSAVERQSAIRCRRKPAHKPCPGHARVALSGENPVAIEWRCSHCEGNGVITGWQKSPWDISQYPVVDHVEDPEDPEDEWLDVRLTQEEFDVLATSLVFDPDSQRIVMGTVWADGEIRLQARASDMDHLNGFIAADANHEKNRKRQRRLQAVFAKVDRSLSEPADPGADRSRTKDADMGYDVDKVDEMALALMYLTSFSEHGRSFSWKGLDWGILNRLHKKGYISDPKRKAKSVALSDEGAALSEQLFKKYFVRILQPV